jgi:hypothetical protein
MAARTRQLENARLTIRAANEAGWDDLQKVFNSTAPASCQCQRYKMQPKECMVTTSVEERAHRFRVQTDPDTPDAKVTTGLVAYLDERAGKPGQAERRGSVPSCQRIEPTVRVRCPAPGK